MQPALGWNLIICWSSVAGKTYSIYRTTDLAVPFTAVATSVPASPPQNQFTDTTAIGPGPFFYRVKITEKPTSNHF